MIYILYIFYLCEIDQEYGAASNILYNKNMDICDTFINVYLYLLYNKISNKIQLNNC
jgi:hypothetical protein